MVARVQIPLGTRRGHLTVIKNDVRVMHSGKLRWGILLECDCGQTKTMANGVFNNLTGKSTRSYCGRSCGMRWAGNEKGIGVKNKPGWYCSYNAMKQRCSASSTGHNRENYYLRGITICPRWLEDPLHFYEDMGERPDGMTLDRIDPAGNYEPANCRWADSQTQAHNKRKTSEQQQNLASY